MKILHIPTGGLFSDGILSCILEYMTAMNKSDMDIRVLATNNAQEDIVQKVEKSGCKVVSIPYRKKSIIKYSWKLYRYILKEKIDIIHVHGSSSLMSIELITAKLAGCKIRIAHSHNTTCENKKADKLLRPIFNKVYTNGFACGIDAGKWLFGRDRFEVIPNSRNLKKYEYNINKRKKYRENLGILDNTLVIGHVGRFNAQKNHKYLINIFHEIHKKNENSKLVLVGEGDTKNTIKELVKNLGLQDNVIFTGVINNVADYLSVFDVMLLPSLYEGLPLVVIEWQIAGLQCVISDTVTKECKITTGLVQFESIDKEPVVWADDVEKLVLKDRNKLKKENWREIRQAGYDIEIEAEKLRKLYLNL